MTDDEWDALQDEGRAEPVENPYWDAPADTGAPALPDPVQSGRGRVLREAADIVSGDRNRYYGPPADNHGCTADLWSAFLRRRFGAHLELTARDVCWLNVLQKASRDANLANEDNLRDVAGYVENASEIASLD